MTKTVFFNLGVAIEIFLKSFFGREIMKLEGKSDDEILELLMEVFEEDARLSMGYIDLEVVDGSITISGRVSSEDELQIITELMREHLEVTDYKNNVWVDETLSYEDPDDNAPDIKDLTFDDDEIDDQEYSDSDEDEDEETF